MKTLVQYIKEAMLRPEDLFIQSIKDAKLSKDNISSMLMNMDMKTVQKISDKLKEEYSDEYFAYEPSKDSFLKQSERESIIDKMSDFCLKFVVQ